MSLLGLDPKQLVMFDNMKKKWQVTKQDFPSSYQIFDKVSSVVVINIIIEINQINIFIA